MTPERFARLKAVLDRRQPDLTVLLDNVHKPHNLAAILRSADAAGVLQAHVAAPQGLALQRPKSAAGSLRWVELVRHASVEQAAARLHERGFQLVAAHPDTGARDFRELDYTRPTAFVLGAELDGLSPAALAAADHTVVVPMHGMVESLNVSVCAALLLYEAMRQREAAGMYDTPRLDAGTRQRLLFQWAWPRIARHCREQGLPYPPLDEATGELRLEGELGQAVRRRARR